jgi:hypothetical protein
MSENNNNSGTNSASKSGVAPKRNNKNRRYKKKPRTNTAKVASGDKPESQSVNGPKKNNNSNKNRRPKALTPSRILQKYDNMMEQYITSRKKYFELYGRSAVKQIGKVKKNYDTALKTIRDFEINLVDWQKEVLDKKINSYPHDREYTKVNNIEPVGDTVAFTGTFEDPHLLDCQKAEKWAEDTEESSGSIEDYQKYKDSM